MCFIYLMSFLDKQTLNYANAYGLRADLKLVGNQFSWVAPITNIGYLVGAYGSTFCLQKYPIGKFISSMLISWGCILIATVAAKNFAGIMALRFLLGALEACIAPAWMLITSMFWTREEQALRMCIWLGSNGISLMLGAGISWGLSHTDNPHIPIWRHGSSFFSEEEKIVSVWRVAGNQTGIKHDKILRYQIKEALLEPRVWCTGLQQLAIGIINASITNFMSALLAGFGYGPTETVLWQLPNGAFQLVCTVAAGLVVSKVRNMSVITILITLNTAVIGVLLWSFNRHRDKEALTTATDNASGEVGQDELQETSFQDRTDRENRAFRYRL
ncbi:hypothetical protein AAE478_005349 [Parahypoxylon ruwenzoriense]